MCTLALYFQVSSEWPVVIAANRDEFLSRPTRMPGVLSENPRVIGGKDLKAGGTWLGLNEFGVVAGLLNRHSEGIPDFARRSRGLLCMDALKAESVEAAAAFAAGQCGGEYNPFNLLLASRETAFVAYNRKSEIEVVELKPGLHLLTNLDIDDFECPKISRSYDHFAALAHAGEFAADPAVICAKMRPLLADHATQLDPRTSKPNAICLHLDGYGTRSSSMIFLGAEQGREVHFFAPGPPCITSYRDAPVPGRMAA
ncbi:MAG: NRDE family protein [Candidatus Binataceae bacterium]